MLVTVPLPALDTIEHRTNILRMLLQGLALGSAIGWEQKRLPPLYQSDVRYQFEPQHGTGIEEFALPEQVFQRKWGDCDDLVIYRVAELTAAGEPATVVVTWPEGTGNLHVMVRRGNGQLEDPSILLGALNVHR